MLNVNDGALAIAGPDPRDEASVPEVQPQVQLFTVARC